MQDRNRKDPTARGGKRSVEKVATWYIHGGSVGSSRLFNQLTGAAAAAAATAARRRRGSRGSDVVERCPYGRYLVVAAGERPLLVVIIYRRIDRREPRVPRRRVPPVNNVPPIAGRHKSASHLQQFAGKRLNDATD